MKRLSNRAGVLLNIGAAIYTRVVTKNKARIHISTQALKAREYKHYVLVSVMNTNMSLVFATSQV